MSRPRCFECGNELMFVKGKGRVFTTWTDPLGHEHKLHKDCFKRGGYGDKAITASPVGEHEGNGIYSAPRSES